MTTALTKSTAATVGGMLKQNKAKLEAAIPKHVNADRLMRVAVQAIQGSPILAQCSVPSLFTSIIRASMLGVEPNGPLAEGYLVPYKNKGVYEAQLIIGYRGLINLARRSGMVTEIFAHIVCENDVFDMELGTNPNIKHKPALSNRGEMVGVYGVYVTSDGSKDFEYMNREEIDRIRASSKGGSSPSSPWNQWYDEMARKTVIRRLSKRMPMSVEMASAVDIDNKTAVGEFVDHGDALDIVGIEVPDTEESEQPDQSDRLEDAVG
jgi:recombination protein RecT